MSIYSTNRTGVMDIANIAMNENYTDGDFNRIIYESQCNDQIIFESILESDFRELQGLREGTILEAELKKLNKDSIKGLAESLKTRVQELWAKLKGAINSAIQKIMAYIMRDGKSFVAEFDEKFAKNGGKFEGSFQALSRTSFDVKVPTASDVQGAVDNAKNGGDTPSGKVNEIMVKLLSDYCGQSVSSTKEYNKVVKEKAFEEKTITNAEINSMRNELKTGKSVIKYIKEAEKRANKEISEISKKLTKEAKEDGTDASDLTTLVSAYEKTLAVTISTKINVAKNELKLYRSNLSKILSETKGTKHESAVEDDVETSALYADQPEEMTAEETKEINDTVEEIDTEIATESYKHRWEE